MGKREGQTDKQVKESKREIILCIYYCH